MASSNFSTRLSALLMLADGRLPVGAHANGSGVEWAAKHDDLSNIDQLERWIDGRLATVGTVDAAFAVAAAASDGSELALGILDAELGARQVGERARLVSRQLGRQFARASRRIWPEANAIHSPGTEGPYAPIALGVVARHLALEPADVATVSLHHLVASATTAAVRLMGLDPLEVAAMHARLAAVIDATSALADSWATAEPAHLPALTSPLAELLAEDHGQWTSRLFLA